MTQQHKCQLLSASRWLITEQSLFNSYPVIHNTVLPSTHPMLPSTILSCHSHIPCCHPHIPCCHPHTPCCHPHIPCCHPHISCCYPHIQYCHPHPHTALHTLHTVIHTPILPSTPSILSTTPPGALWWSVVHSLSAVMWFYPLCAMEISGFEVVCTFYLSPVLTLIGPIRRAVSTPLGLMGLRLLTLVGVASFQVCSGYSLSTSLQC